MPGTDLSEACVLLAGATGGIGSALARELVQRGGATLALLARHAEKLEALDLPGLRLPTDIQDPRACERAVERVLDEHGAIHGLINAAGVVAFGPLTRTDDDVLDTMFATNAIGPLRLIRAALPHMREGFIANITAIVVEQPMPGLVAYCAAKGALATATAALRLEVGLRGRDIDVIDARPPHTETGLAERPIAGRAPKLPKGLQPRHVARRIIEAIEAGETEIPSRAFLAGKRE
jgi:NAD(P)-dependent dehydrogenase (short-subunit alcohol dehydrogenase family)